MNKKIKKIGLIISLTLLLFFISRCEKPEKENCVICETEVINIHYKKPEVVIEFKNQIDTLCDKTIEEIERLEGLNSINDTRDSVINIWSTNCH